MPDNQESKELEQKRELSENCTSCEKQHCNWTGEKGMLCQECWEDEASRNWWNALATNKMHSLEKQLTATQQALNSAVEALEDARNFLIVSTGVHRNIVLEKVETALTTIEGK